MQMVIQICALPITGGYPGGTQLYPTEEACQHLCWWLPWTHGPTDVSVVIWEVPCASGITDSTLCPPSPMNFLISPQHRLPYIVLFPILASDLLSHVLTYGSAGNVSNIFIINVLYKVCKSCRGCVYCICVGQTSNAHEHLPTDTSKTIFNSTIPFVIPSPYHYSISDPHMHTMHVFLYRVANSWYPHNGQSLLLAQARKCLASQISGGRKA